MNKPNIWEKDVPANAYIYKEVEQDSKYYEFLNSYKKFADKLTKKEKQKKVQVEKATLIEDI